MYVSFSICFHHRAPAVKASLSDFPDWEGSSFYGPEHSELYESDSGPSVLYLPLLKYHVCLSLKRIYSADSLVGTLATVEGIRFSLYLFASFFLLWKGSLSCDTTGKLPFLLAIVPWKMRLEKGRQLVIEDKGHNRVVIHCNLTSPVVAFLLSPPNRLFY